LIRTLSNDRVGFIRFSGTKNIHIPGDNKEIVFNFGPLDRRIFAVNI